MNCIAFQLKNLPDRYAHVANVGRATRDRGYVIPGTVGKIRTTVFDEIEAR